MAASTYIPAIISAVFTPNPAEAGQEVLLSVEAVDIECVLYTQVIAAGEFSAGEV